MDLVIQLLRYLQAMFCVNFPFYSFQLSVLIVISLQIKYCLHLCLLKRWSIFSISDFEFGGNENGIYVENIKELFNVVYLLHVQ